MTSLQYQSQLINLHEYYRSAEKPSGFTASSIGLNLAKLHLLTMNYNSIQRDPNLKQNLLSDRLCNSHPFAEILVDNLKPKHLKTIPIQSLRFVGIYQKSVNIRTILENLIFSPYKYCLIHSRLNFAKILVPIEQHISLDISSDMVTFLNCEACDWGDPALDLGTVIGGYFLLWLNSMIAHSTIEVKLSIQTATIPVASILTSVSDLLKSYISINSQILEQDVDFVLRSIRFAGLEIICQLLEDFQTQPQSAVNRQFLYFHIASQLLSKPEKFISFPKQL